MRRHPPFGGCKNYNRPFSRCVTAARCVIARTEIHACVAAVVMTNSVMVEMLHTTTARVLARWPDAYPSPQPVPEGSRFPPAEQFRQETFQRRRALKSLGTRAFCQFARPCPANERVAQKTGHIRRSFMDDMKGTWIRSEPR